MIPQIVDNDSLIYRVIFREDILFARENATKPLEVKANKIQIVINIT